MAVLQQPSANMPVSQLEMLPTPGFFSAAMGGDEDLNPFDQSFRQDNERVDMPKPSTSTENLLQPPNASDDFLQSLADGTFSPLFSFSPKPSTPKSELSLKQAAMLPRLTPGLAPSHAWTPSNQEQILRRGQQLHPQQQASPPQSANSPSSRGQLDEQSLPSVAFTKDTPQLSILEAISSEVRSAFGQITPTSDASQSPCDKSSRASSSSSSISTSGLQSFEPAKRRRNRSNLQTTIEAPAAPANTPPKRQRKPSSVSKSELARTSSELPDDPSSISHHQGQPDAKRNRFLERNRVAASKCRQKKKEWTSNLESKARELQQDKAQLSMMVSSLKDEMLFLKGELLKHSSCDCHKIRQYLNNEASSFAANPSMQRGGAYPPASANNAYSGSPVDPIFHDPACSGFTAARQDTSEYGSGGDSEATSPVMATAGAGMARSGAAATDSSERKFADLLAADLAE